MSAKLFKNSFLYTLGTLFPTLSGFLLLPLYTSYLSPADYGVLSAVQVVNSVLVLVFTLAIDKAIYRMYFDYKTEKDKKDYLGTIFFGLCVVVTVLTFLLFGIPDILGSIYKDIAFYPYMFISLITSALTTLNVIPKANYFVKEKAGNFIMIAILEFIIKNAFIIVFVVYLEQGVIGYLEGQLYGTVLVIPLLLYLTFKNINLTFVTKWFYNSLRFSLPMLPMLISAWVMNASDRIFIERYYTAHDVGIYSLGYKIAMLVSIFASAFYKAYNPFYFKTAANEIRENALAILKKTNSIYLLILIIGSALIALFAREAISIFFDERYYEAYKIVGIVSLSFAVGAASGIFNLAIYQEKKTVFLMIVNLLSAGVNIGLNFLLVPTMGAMGAAWATLITYIVLLVISFYYGKNCFYASFYKEMVYLVFIVLLIIGIFFYYIEFELITSIAIKILVFVAISYFIWSKYKNTIIQIFNTNS